MTFAMETGIPTSRRSKWFALAVVAILAAMAGTALQSRAADGQVGGVGSGTADWNGWTFDYGVESGFDGLSLRGLRYNDTLMAARVSLPVMNVFYENNACGPYADRLGGTIYGTFINEFTQDGERWLEISIEDRIGAYVLYQSYYFSESGQFDAHMFSKGLQCYTYHEHLPFWRFDFDIDGAADDQILRRLPDGSLEALGSEFDARADSATGHEWYVRDSVSGRTALVQFDDGTFNKTGTVVPETAYARNNVYGRQYSTSTAEQTWSGGPTGTLGFNEGTVMSDVVLWYTAFMPHSAEEGEELWHSTGVRISLVDDPTLVDPGPPPGTGDCAGLDQEAEQAFLSGSMTLVADGEANGGGYIEAPEGSGYVGSADDANAASFCYTVDQPGLYQLEGDVAGPDGGSDSFFVTVNETTYLWDVSPGSTFTTDRVADRGGDDPVSFDLAAGDTSITVHVREDGTRLDTLRLVRVGESGTGGGDGSCRGLAQQAEAAALSGRMVGVSDAAAQGNSYIEVPEGSGNAGTVGSSSRAQFCFDVPTAGTYVLSAIAQGVSGTSDSFFVVVDDGPAALWDLSTSGGFATDEVSDRTGTDPVIYDLAAGEHTVTVYLREDGTRLDELSLVQRDVNSGGACAGLAQQAEAAALSGRMVGVSDAAAQGNSYIEVPEGSGNAGTVGSSSRAQFCFDVPTAGTYVLSAIAQGVSGTSDSFFVVVDDGPAALWDLSTSGGFATDEVSDRTGTDPVIYDLAAGEHTVTVYLREDGTRLDALSLAPR